ncbi:MAG: hypothetical protein ACI80K_000701 [Paracoccaceae bacterium]|jgi:hypothetical protein
MLKAIGTIQLMLAPVFVVPALTAQDGETTSPMSGQSLQDQLDATLASVQYLAGLRSAARAGDTNAVRAIVHATEAPRGATIGRAATLQDDLARLRFQLDRLLGDPDEVSAITAMPASVVTALGLSGPRPASLDSSDVLTGRSGVLMPRVTGPTSAEGASNAAGEPAVAVPDATVTPTVLTSSPNVLPNPMAARPDHIPGTGQSVGSLQGLDASMRAALSGGIGPLDHVSDSSRRRGNEAVTLEEKGYVADPMHLGKLLVRAKRPAEAVEILKHQTGPGGRYWLARAFQDLDREAEATALFRLIADDGTAGIYSRHASKDLEFLEFKAALRKKR